MTYQDAYQSTRVLSVNITAVVHEGSWTGTEGRTGIDKRPVEGAVRVANNCIAGDVVVDKKHHGGYDKAVYAYAREDADWWEEKIGRPLSNGSFGENLTTQGIDLNKSVIGERWQIASTILEVSEPRIPCRVFAGFWEQPALIKDFTSAKRSGAYLRIIQEGEISANDELKVISKPEHGATILDLFMAKSGERGKIEQLKRVENLSEYYKEWLSKL